MSDEKDPTVEDILQSIKQVIARENRAMADAARTRIAPREEAAPTVADDESDVLDLAEADALVEAIETEVEVHDEDEASAELVSGATQASMRESLAALAMLSEPGAPPQIVRSGETSVEDLMRELLRPTLAEWLDRNLPPLVEKLVTEEIRRISGRKG